MQELNQSNIGAAVNESTLVNSMPFGDCSMTYLPLVQGGYTNLLLQEQIHATTFSSSRRLHFDDNTSTPTQN